MHDPTNNDPRLCFRQLRRPQLNRSESRKISSLARALDEESRFARERIYFEPFARRGMGSGALTVIGDVREIPLMAEHSSSVLEYRLSTLARSEDVVVIGTGRNAGFEDYRANVLRFGSADYLETGSSAPGHPSSTAVRCLEDAETYQELMQKVRAHRSATVLSHITTGTIWALARKLGKDTGLSMRVAGPLPTLSRLANNKLWFSKVTGTLLGPDTVPVECPVHGAAALTGKVRSLSQHSNRLVIKVPDSAGSVGNFVVSCEEIRKMDLRETHRHLADMLSTVDGHLHFPLVVQVWENKVLTSPSVQIWIPHHRDGGPIVEGIYEQTLSGSRSEFSGAVQATLPPEWDKSLAHQGLILATLFQELGYFGRCSFDSVISGDDFGSARLLWIECNARWGGVSVPMTFLSTLFRGSEMPASAIHHAPAPGLTLRRQSFEEGIEKVRDLLWMPGRSKGIIFLTPSGFEAGEKLHFISLEASVDLARQLAEQTVRRLAEGL